MKSASENATPGKIINLSEHLAVYCGAINAGIIRDGDKALIIDCGDCDNGLIGSLAELGVKSVERIIFTHHHRDQACGAHSLAAKGAKIGVPAAERGYFENVEDYWNNPDYHWHLYEYRPHHLMLADSIDVDEAYEDGQEFEWGAAKLTAFATPGHTDGGMSYLVDVDGRRIIFSGDLIYAPGQLWEIHSMQKGELRGGGKKDYDYQAFDTRFELAMSLDGIAILDYHGFMGTRYELAGSLERIKNVEPDAIVPSHGMVMGDPPTAIDSLLARVSECHDKYVAASSLRHYFPWLLEKYTDRPHHMPIRANLDPPACLRHLETSWILVSEDKSIFVMDVALPSVVDDIQKLVEEEEIKSVEGLWITHYHDDHVGGVSRFLETYGCPCYAEEHVAGIITNPHAWRLPAVDPIPCRVDNVTTHGQSWQWREFRMTSYYLPGQTLYDAALLVEKDDLRMLFVGDSFTHAGMDAYCTLNRNWLGEGVGFNQCLALIEELKPTHMFNPHVELAFDFTPEQIQYMYKNLAEQEELYGQLFPWDHANYGTDESWVRSFPYSQKAISGKTVDFDVVITNHSSDSNSASCRAVPPACWKLEPTAWSEGTIPAKTEGKLSLSCKIPADVEPGCYAIPIDVRYGVRTLPQFVETLVEVE